MSLTPMRRIFSALMACGLIVIAFTPFCFSQQRPGAIQGTVTDQLDSLVVNATIVIKDAQGKERTAVTHSSGSYEFRSLSSGNYYLQAFGIGFSILQREKGLVEAVAGPTPGFVFSNESLQP